MGVKLQRQSTTSISYHLSQSHGRTFIVDGNDDMPRVNAMMRELVGMRRAMESILWIILLLFCLEQSRIDVDDRSVMKVGDRRVT